MTDSLDKNMEKDIILYKEDKGTIYGYLNQKALDLALYNRAKEKTNNFEIKAYNGQDKRAVQLDDITIQRHSIVGRAVSNGEYISEGDVILDIGLEPLSCGSYFRDNYISEYDTWLCVGIKLFSKYSGYFFNEITDKIMGSSNFGNTIKDGDLLFTIQLADKPKDAEAVIKAFSFSLNLLGKEIIEKMPYLSDINLEQWLVPNYSYVEKDTDVLVLSASSKYSHYGSKVIKTPYSGLLVQKIQPEQLGRNKHLTMFRVYPNESYLIDNFKYKFDVKKDDFNNSCIIQCKVKHSGVVSMFSGLGLNMFNGYIYFNFEYIGGKYYLILNYDNKEINLDKYCTLHLRMDNGNTLTLNPAAKPVKDSSYYICKFQLSKADLDDLGDAKLVKWRISNRDGIPLVERFNSCLKDGKDPTDITQRLSYIGFQKFFKDFSKTVEENAPKTELEEIKNDVHGDSYKSCYVYLMIDTTNNFHKIGISNHPKYREHTLQSDKPTIELVCAKEYPTRTIAEAIEGALHRAYAAKRIRGEWFNLDSSDIEDVKNTLK